jgi:uncharacterized protein (DUF1501 family)
MVGRRRFLAQGAGALAGLTGWPTSLQARAQVFVPILLRGGLDGLSLVAPYGDPAYRCLRPHIALPAPGRRAGLIDLDGFFGLHPCLAPLMPWWRRGHLAVVHACGLPQAMPSHFDAQDAVERVMARMAPRRELPSWMPPVPSGRGCWDTHAAQGSTSGALAERLGRLAGDLAAFATALGERLDEVELVVLSEFGRTVHENERGGTDHGHAGAVLVLGGRVNGGRVHGWWPGLDPSGGPLAVTTEVSRVLAVAVS